MENKYSIILGNLGNTCDRFCKSYKTNPSSERMLELAAENMPYIGGVELVGHLSGNAELDQIGVGADEDLLVATTLELAGDLLDGAGTMVRNGVENETISH